MAEDFDFVETDSAKLYTTIIGQLMEECSEPLYPGDERRIFGEALVLVFVGVFNLFNDKAKQRTLQYARGLVLDAIGGDVKRAAPSSASAVFRFTASAAQSENIIIPAGTRITADGNVYFATKEIAVLSAGSLYVDVLGECTEGGSDFNGYAAGSIGTLVDLIPFISAAANITISNGGDDGEPYDEAGDNRYRERIRLAKQAQSTAGPESAYRYFALSADPDIVAVSVVCPEDEPNTVNIYPLMSGGVLPDAETLQKVQAVFADDVRPMCDLVQALAPEPVPYSVEIKYYCTAEDEAATILAVEGEGGALDQYNAWQAADLGRAINPDKLRSYLYNAGASMVDVVSPGRAILEKYQVAQLSGAVTVSHEVIDA